jgi:hypothetical protein
LGGGRGSDLEAIYNSCLILKTVLRKQRQSPSRHVVRFRGQLKLKKIILRRFYYIFQYCNASSADFSGWFKLQRKSRKTWYNRAYTMCSLNFTSEGRGWGDYSQAAPSPWVCKGGECLICIHQDRLLRVLNVCITEISLIKAGCFCSDTYER